MASNCFGNIFRITTWGESHGKAIGVVIDGCPAGVAITDDDINADLALRSPGKSPFTSPRQETDHGEILSGVFNGLTTGTPISIIIWNRDADSSKYEAIKDLLRPGHASFTYLKKYGAFDYRGGGRASARETAGRVAAGAVAKKFLAHFNIRIAAYVQRIAGVEASPPAVDLKSLREATYKSEVFCPDPAAAAAMAAELTKIMDRGDSVGGVVEAVVEGLPAGLGDPVYEKLSGNISRAMMSIPATRGIEIGSGFAVADLNGSTNNDVFYMDGDVIRTKTNYAGGVLGGMSTGMPLVFKVAFKPASSIKIPLDTIDTKGNKQTFNLPAGSRHDPCVAIRAVTVVEAMTAITLADSILMNRSAQA